MIFCSFVNRRDRVQYFSNFLQNMLEKMCAWYNCGDTSCDDPVMAYGQCCPVCGALITMGYVEGYTETAMKEYLQSEALKVSFIIIFASNTFFVCIDSCLS